ncbi:methyltransferase domain-containing protein [Neoactinobaculum massilliense]|uniref:methyltransferase domain-containing protein n=1 Tax=Neoactinobaculum massilliense TaxID=2364794 RepID=UPI000F52A47E|nr:methyltransferase domain-containing protein [Neoactinobaculum massilliense]
MHCSYFDANICRSCTRMGVEFSRQIAVKQERLERMLAPWKPAWLAPCTGPESYFRNKAKMVAGGSTAAPTLGILGAGQEGVDLTGCGLYEPAVTASFEIVREFIRRASLTPFHVPTGRGELKHVLVTASPTGQLMVRFVLRSTESVVRIRKHLPWLREQLPTARVITANLLPERKALTEGAAELVLTEEELLPMPIRLDDADVLPLFVGPGAFFQTNSTIASGMYSQARAWMAGLEAAGLTHARVWDLYCGVGGFALALASPGRRLVGVEVSAPAVEAARRGAETMRERAGEPAGGAEFFVGDAAAAVRDLGGVPDVLVVNPPRRGLTDLAPWIERTAPRYLIYSSCNPRTLVTDLERMPGYRVREARLMDMFPQTDHMEAMVLAERR